MENGAGVNRTSGRATEALEAIIRRFRANAAKPPPPLLTPKTTDDLQKLGLLQPVWFDQQTKADSLATASRQLGLGLNPAEREPTSTRLNLCQK
jgi:hypothetical protein